MHEMVEIPEQFSDPLFQRLFILSKIGNFTAEELKQYEDSMKDMSDYYNIIDTAAEEAEKRGLLNLKTTPDALPYFIKEKNIELFTRHKVYTEKEMHSRYEILSENYCKLIRIEGRTMVDMAMKDILPAVSEYSQVLCNTLAAKKAVCESVDCSYETEMVEKISSLTKDAYTSVKGLQKALDGAEKVTDVTELAMYYKDKVLTKMQSLRDAADSLENIVSADYWPFPTYGELLFGVSE